MAQFKNLFLVMLLTFGLAACSASKKADDEGDSVDEVPSADADTDVVPDEDLAELDEESFGDEGGDEMAQPEQKSGDFAMAETTDSAPPMETPPPADTSIPAPTTDFAAAGTGNWTNYTVKQGDTLMKIAFETYGDLYQWKRIYEANRNVVGNFNQLAKGTVLKVEQPGSPVQIDRNGTPYLIKVGDTLGTISKDVYGSQNKWKRLWENNRQLIRDPNKIYAGFYLYYTVSPQDEQDKMQGTKNPQPVANEAPAEAVPNFQGATEAMDLQEEAPAAPDARAPSSN